MFFIIRHCILGLRQTLIRYSEYVDYLKLKFNLNNISYRGDWSNINSYL